MITINKSKGSPRPKKQPERQCIACRQMKPKADLLRVVRSSFGGTYAIDGKGKAPGRGAYLCRDEGCMAKALKSRAFDRSFKGKVPQEIYEDLGMEQTN